MFHFLSWNQSRMGSNACQDKDVQKTLRNTTNVFHYQTSVLLIYRNLFAFCSLWKPPDDGLCLHVISFVTTLSYHKSGARTELWHMHKSSVDLNGASSTLYDFLSQNRMTESHTHRSDHAVSLPLQRGYRATNSDSHSVSVCLIYRPVFTSPFKHRL